MQQVLPRNDSELAELERYVVAHPATPQFVRLAAAWLERDNPAQALKVCLGGLKHLPESASGMLLAAKSYVLLRQYSDAREMLHTVLRSVPGAIVARRLLEHIPVLELDYPPHMAMVHGAEQAGQFPQDGGKPRAAQWSRQSDVLPSFLPPTVSRVATESDTHGEEVRVPVLDLSRLAEQLEGARIRIPVEENPRVDEEDSEVETVNLVRRPHTETLAEIYVAQGRYLEAIESYRHLIALRPEKREDFANRILVLERLHAASVDDGASSGGES